MRPSPLERSRLCDACTHACSMSVVGCTKYTCQTHKSQLPRNDQNSYPSSWDALNDISRWAKWSKTKRDFLAETSSSGCHLCIMIAHAFDGKSKELFERLGGDEVVRLCFKYRTVERDPSGKLGWEERTNMAITDIALGIDLPDEFWLAIRSDKGSVLEDVSFDLRIRPLQGDFTSACVRRI
ncbi:hypothetical protein FPHYL_14288 [Fusarium phyllophilum]|uniref:Uncharacterized protein n=1 Tax=Fusarium phyllophilum TaxID=47803 RepID=A0A8H5MHL3_9HYPO|nr:hypothetical protein FPHYL_14288 [Fusarium phyllophilum]